MNQVKEPPSEMVMEALQKEGLALGGIIQEDHTVYEFDLEGKPTIELPGDNLALQSAYAIFNQIIT
jgi:CO dehydrogenase maturation factor